MLSEFGNMKGLLSELKKLAVTDRAGAAAALIKLLPDDAVDVTEAKKLQDKLIMREKTLAILNGLSTMLLLQNDRTFADAMTEGVRLLSGSAGFDRMSIFRNVQREDGIHSKQIYRWVKESGGTADTLASLEDLPLSASFPWWDKVLASGKCINSPARLTDSAGALERFGVVTMFVVPIISNGHFWGFAFFENLRDEQPFTENETELMQAASALLANAVIRGDADKPARKAEEYARLMLDANPLACRLWDRDFNIIECNEAVVKLYELKDKEEYKRRFFELLPEYQPDGQKSIDKIRNAITETFKKGSCSYPIMFQLLDGTPIPAENVLYRVRYGNDYVVAAYSRDLREHVKMLDGIKSRDLLMQTVNEAADILMRATPEDFNESIYRCMGMMATAIGADRMFVFVNYTENGNLHCTQICEWSEKAKSFKDSEILTGVCFKDEAPATLKILQRGHSFHSLIRDVPPSDRSIYMAQGILAVLLIPVFIHNQFWGYVGFDNCHEERLFTENEEAVMRSGSVLIAEALLRNDYIKSIQNTAAQLQDALTDAQTANAAKSTFLAHMSHEIRTPMNVILGITDVLVQKESLPADITEGLRRIYASGRQLTGIINDILDFSKIEAGKMDIIPAPYKVASLISDALHLNMLHLDRKTIDIALQVDENIPATLIGDELRIKQILNNLLSNALKYTDAGVVTMRVGFRQGAEDNITLILEVQDTGHGMTKQQIEKLYEEYSRFQQDRFKTIEGSGLGMPITQRLIHLMNGEIRVESELGRGSLFVVSLPQKTVGAKVLGGKLAGALSGFTNSFSTNSEIITLVRDPMPYGKVLVVDDMETNTYVIAGLLKLYDIEAETVMNGYDAVHKIRDGNVYDIVFMDHMMPRMDGIETTRHMRVLGYKEPIVALTANAVTGQADIFLESGFDDFIAKPIDVRQLEAVLKRLIRDKQPPEMIEAARLYKGDKQQRAVEPAPPMLSSFFVKDADKAIAVIEECCGADALSDEARLRQFLIAVHGMSSALAAIGEAKLSVVAKNLELLGKQGNVVWISELASGFLADLRALRKRLAPGQPFADSENADEDIQNLRERLLDIKKLCGEFDRKGVNGVLAGLKKNKCSPNTGEMLERIKEAVFLGDFDEAGELAESYAASLTE